MPTISKAAMVASTMADLSRCYRATPEFRQTVCALYGLSTVSYITGRPLEDGRGRTISLWEWNNIRPFRCTHRNSSRWYTSCTECLHTKEYNDYQMPQWFGAPPSLLSCRSKKASILKLPRQPSIPPHLFPPFPRPPPHIHTQSL